MRIPNFGKFTLPLASLPYHNPSWAYGARSFSLFQQESKTMCNTYKAIRSKSYLATALTPKKDLLHWIMVYFKAYDMVKD